LATPRFAEIEEGRSVLFKNIALIRSRSLKGDRSAAARDLDRAKGQGDVAAQDELLKELDRVARTRRSGTKRGLS
jgi:hypothetical protein